ncbi:hypothetical protein ANN_14573 [Periplaneta americana]|uniref:Aminopeptidase N-like N-terminal domain-containing protein n=1 Tax=Periplaneta americana TaxID=6978 RepID=A0ABQ8SWQ3_PERAM|nr:hypothetical protein ANN_14573 [Periplaneta americana]
MVLDPTIRFERNLSQADEVNKEKQEIYEPCLSFFSSKYNISVNQWVVKVAEVDKSSVRYKQLLTSGLDHNIESQKTHNQSLRQGRDVIQYCRAGFRLCGRCQSSFLDRCSSLAFNNMVRQIALLLALVSIVLSYDTQLLLSNLKGQQPLPRTVKPYIYLLELHPRLSEGYFNGSVDIHIQCLEPTKIIVLHAHQDLQLENITFTAISTGYAVPTIKEIERNDSTDTLTLTLEKELTERDSYQLHIEFNGLLKTADYQYTATSGGGFFRGTYMDEKTLEMRWFAMTSMFPGSARRVFPCFDEPSFKAEFLIGVTHSINMTVLTGWPSYFNQSTEEEGYIKEYFGRTIRIAPFSVGVLVSSFNSSIAMNVTSSQGTTELDVHHVRAPYQPVSMTLAPKVLQFLEDYLQARFPVMKVDIVAMPSIPYDVKSDFPGLILVQ